MYTKYFNTCYPEAEPLTQIKLGKKILNLKCDRIEEGRIHKSRKGPYNRGFVGMALKENYLEISENEQALEETKTDIENFEIILNNIIGETFKDVHFDKRKAKATIDSNTEK